MRLPRRSAGVTAWATVLGSKLLYHAGRKPWAYAMLRHFGLKSGDGPSEQQRKDGFFRAQFFAYSGAKLLARFSMHVAGDPGNEATALLSCESALCLVDNVAQIPAKRGGFWTPSTALGDALYTRLAQAGVHFETHSPGPLAEAAALF